MKRKSVLLLLTAAILICSVLSAKAQNNRIYNLKDPVTGFDYSVSIVDGKVTVKSQSTLLGETYAKDIDACSVCNGLLYLYSADSLNKALTVYTFDFYADRMEAETINEDAFKSSLCFACNNKGTKFFVLGNDTKSLCIYGDKLNKTVNLKSQIKELLCVDGKRVLAITSTNTYLCNEYEVTQASDYTLCTPVYCLGNGELTDSLGDKYSLTESELIKVKDPTPTQAASKAVNYTVEDYLILEQGTTVYAVKKALARLEIEKVTKADGKIITNGKLGTGTVITFKTGESTVVVIPGEVTGEGNINSRDLKKILNHLSEKELLTGAFEKAADIDRDGKITTVDALLSARMS